LPTEGAFYEEAARGRSASHQLEVKPRSCSSTRSWLPIIRSPNVSRQSSLMRRPDDNFPSLSWMPCAVKGRYEDGVLRCFPDRIASTVPPV
jgi:hypothetical protein